MSNPVKIPCLAPDLFKALVILSDTTARRFAVEREDLKPYRKSEKKGHTSVDDQQSYYLQVFKDFTNFTKTLHRKTNAAIVFSCRSFPSIFRYKDHQ